MHLISKYYDITRDNISAAYFRNVLSFNVGDALCSNVFNVFCKHNFSRENIQ